MGIKLVDADEPSQSITKVEKVSTSVLPREEAYRLRRQVRSIADQAAPWALKCLLEMANETDDPKFKRLLCLDVLSLSTSKKSNEEVDPEGPTVNGESSKAEDDALAVLESSTEEGTGDNE